MQQQESLEVGKALAKALDESPACCVINLGSGDVEKLKRDKPWVDQNVMQVAQRRGVSVVHSDLVMFPGVDIKLDLCDSGSIETFKDAIKSPAIYLLNNVLEHLPRRKLTEVCNGIQLGLMRPGDRLVVTVPYKYPYHPDPIDSLFRPSPSEIARLFSGLTPTAQLIVDCSSFGDELKGMTKAKRIRKFLKPLLLLMRPQKYLSDLHRLTFLYRRYRSSLVVLEKPISMIPPPRQISPS